MKEHENLVQHPSNNISIPRIMITPEFVLIVPVGFPEWRYPSDGPGKRPVHGLSSSVWQHSLLETKK